MEGVEKNTIESRIALSTSAAATASTASEPPIIVKRRCLRVMNWFFSNAWIVEKHHGHHVIGKKVSRHVHK
jgi:hypothetical protein